MEGKRRRVIEERSRDYWSPSGWTVLFGARALDKQSLAKSSQSHAQTEFSPPEGV